MIVNIMASDLNIPFKREDYDYFLWNGGTEVISVVMTFSLILIGNVILN